MPTCPRPTITSPGLAAAQLIARARRAIAPDCRGNRTPAEPYADCTSFEQSYRPRPVPYRAPTFDRANTTTRERTIAARAAARAAGVGALRAELLRATSRTATVRAVALVADLEAGRTRTRSARSASAAAARELAGTFTGAGRSPKPCRAGVGSAGPNTAAIGARTDPETSNAGELGELAGGGVVNRCTPATTAGNETDRTAVPATNARRVRADRADSLIGPGLSRAPPTNRQAPPLQRDVHRRRRDNAPAMGDRGGVLCARPQATTQTGPDGRISPR
jgi:hypothetical protein